MKTRQNSTALIIGTRGTGKSEFIKQILKSSSNRKAIIFDTDDNAVFHGFDKITPELIPHVKSGQFRVIDTDFNKVVDLMAGFWNGLLILEDATKYISGKLPENFANLIIASKQRNVDIVLTFHNFRCIHPRLFLLANFLEIFKTGEDLLKIDSVKNKLPKFDEVLKVQLAVEAHPSKYHHQTIQIL